MQLVSLGSISAPPLPLRKTLENASSLMKSYMSSEVQLKYTADRNTATSRDGSSSQPSALITTGENNSHNTSL